MRSFPTIESGKDGERLEPKHPLSFARAPSLLRSRTSQRVATETRGAGFRAWSRVCGCCLAAVSQFPTVVWRPLEVSDLGSKESGF